ncbi:hypothetical protein HPB48_022926 [Haemaphysalis longicornis]|uniref:Uncharacterized protein n=1 Tax=Haemaphysalis longicornis TaxID=44386 RepID=A0A9J6GDI5_HAELO|nr:hypothetical protein HPB48_022926 [Haemaphysalis longicornis]
MWFFSDESTFSSRWDQRKRVWQTENTCFGPQNSQKVAASARLYVNVWGAILHKGLVPLGRIDGRFTTAAYSTLLEHDMVLCVLNGPHPDGFYFFKQDLSAVTPLKDVARLLEGRGVMQLQWCAKGADMNIIELVWGRMKVNLPELPLKLANSDQLWEAIEHEWNRLQRDTAFIEALYASLPR